MDSEQEMRQAVGHILRTARKAKKLTLLEVANRVGCGPDRIGEYERGNNLPAFPRLVRLCYVLDVKLQSLGDQVMRFQVGEKNKGPKA